MCSLCFQTFVTRECSGSDLKMPELTQSRHRKRLTDRARPVLKGSLSNRSKGDSASLATALSAWHSPVGASSGE